MKYLLLLTVPLACLTVLWFENWQWTVMDPRYKRYRQAILILFAITVGLISAGLIAAVPGVV